MSGTAERKRTRAERLSMPVARKVVKDVAVEHGACIRPLQLRRTDLATGEVDQVLVPCGHTLASVCSSCAKRAKALCAAQCREGWHLEEEPVVEPDPPTEMQCFCITKRAEAQLMHDQADAGASTRLRWESCSTSWMRKSPTPGCAARS